MNNLKETPLFIKHNELGAQMTPFNGWNIPLSYKGIIQEHNFCRNKSAIFDICHMGEFIFTGDTSGIEAAVTPSLSEMNPGRGKYGFLLNSNGGIIDDLIIFKTKEDELLIVVNASTVENDFNVINDRITSGTLKNVSNDTAKLDLQGPLSRDVIIDTLGLDINLSYFSCSYFTVMGEDIFISRTGYTGELGYEIYSTNNTSCLLWDKFLSDKRVKPAGLGARDILRLEMGYSLYGSDIDEDTTPLEAGLGMFINFNKDFVGKNALLKEKKEGPKKIKISFKTNSRRAPRQHYKILSKDNVIGEVTSGSFSPVLSYGIGLGYIDPEYAQKENTFIISDGKKIEIQAEITEVPFYKEGSLRRN